MSFAGRALHILEATYGSSRFCLAGKPDVGCICCRVRRTIFHSMLSDMNSILASSKHLNNAHRIIEEYAPVSRV